MMQTDDKIAAQIDAIKRRIVSGEVIGIVCTATNCNKCGDSIYGYRMGCKCGSKDFVWGLFVNHGADGISKFMTLDQVIAIGLPAIDMLTGDTVELVQPDAARGE